MSQPRSPQHAGEPVSKGSLQAVGSAGPSSHPEKGLSEPQEHVPGGEGDGWGSQEH